MHPAAFRKLLADVIAAEKSYSVPSICSAIGLAAGSEQEAFNGKFRYAKKRLDAVPDSQLFDVAGRLNSMVESDELVQSLKENTSSSPSDEINSKSLARLGSKIVSDRWQSALNRRDNDPDGAITLARTLLEDICKTIIISCDQAYSEDDDLTKLYRKTSGLLNLAPDQHTEQAFKQILGSCQSVVETIGSIRNKLGDAHSVGPIRSRPSQRHATLAVNLAGTMATFLADTWQEKIAKSE